MKVEIDSKPLAEFGPSAADLIEQIRTSGRPLALTESGHSTAVLIDASKYEAMVEELALLRDIRTAAAELDSGQALSDEDARAELRRRLAP
jgi:prevent-host-death family protein